MLYHDNTASFEVIDGIIAKVHHILNRLLLEVFIDFYHDNTASFEVIDDIFTNNS